MKFRTFLLAVGVALSTAIFAGASNASDLQINTVKKETIEVGTKDYSMLSITGRKIMHVDVDNAHCDISIERSKSVGKLIFKAKTEEAFTLFITDDYDATYAIDVNPNPEKKADFFILKNLKAEQKIQEALSAKSKYKDSTVKVIDLSSSHQKTAIDLLKAMALSETPRNVDTTVLNETIELWIEAEIKAVKQFEVGTLIGKEYELVNLSKEEMRLAEAEFYQVQKQTMAIAIAKPVLAPGEATKIYIISEQD